MTFIHNPPPLLKAWMLISSIIVLWDAAYVFLRPYSLPNSPSPLHYIWYPYKHYAPVDHNYSIAGYLAGDGFPAAQSILNVIESGLNLTYLFLASKAATAPTPAQKRRQEVAAVIVGLVGTVMTESKTGLYWLTEICGGWGGAEAELWSLPFGTLFWFWLLPNGFWLTMPAWCAWRFSKDLVRGVVGEDGQQGVERKKVR
ncbi:hypothetical protein BJ508DRAFT_229931 [Ascobolus immersus RN42]|uniref:EXPERA domain-containing protein n=1 Tax=Ascobolus immersus RN42 TaxID=1160509 RepID=A0A3N4I1E7_ASCIM|nr:hypothetical protein BJ508DRAFT_229931 [Ascobolus immersus RN42]